MATAAVLGHGTLFKRNGTTVAEVISISGPGLTMDPIDATSMDSTGGWKEFIGGLLDGGEVTLELNFLPADTTQNFSATGIGDDFENKTKQSFSLVFSDSGTTTWSFSAFVTSFNPSASVSDKLTLSVTVKITGQPTLV